MIDIEIEKLIKIDCLNKKCPHHLESRGFFSCNMKRIMISEEGKCLGYKKIERINKNRTYSEDTKESLEKMRNSNKSLNLT